MEPFYYTKMTKQQQAAYHVIMQGANALADEFQIPRIESAELYDVFSGFGWIIRRFSG